MTSLESFTATTAGSVPLHSKSHRGMTDSPLGQRPLSQQLAQPPPLPLCRLWARNSFNAKDFCFGIFLSLILSNQSLLQMPVVSQNTVSKIPFAASLTLMPLSSLQETVHPYLTKQSFYPLNPFQLRGAENPVLKVCAVAAVKEKGRREGALMREGGHETRHLESARLFQRKIIPFATFFLFLKRDAKRCKKQV